MGHMGHFLQNTRKYENQEREKKNASTPDGPAEQAAVN